MSTLVIHMQAGIYIILTSSFPKCHVPLSCMLAELQQRAKPGGIIPVMHMYVTLSLVPRNLQCLQNLGMMLCQPITADEINKLKFSFGKKM